MKLKITTNGIGLPDRAFLNLMLDEVFDDVSNGRACSGVYSIGDTNARWIVDSNKVLKGQHEKKKTKSTQS